jgi:hypothetical protein
MPPATIAPAIPPTSNNVDNCALSAGLRVAETNYSIIDKVSGFNNTQN